MKKELVDVFYIDSFDTDYLEFCFFEWESYKDLLSYILLKRNEFSLELNEANYTYFMNELKEARYKYFLKLRDVINNYCPQYNSPDYDIVANFEDSTISIYKKECE